VKRMQATPVAVAAAALQGVGALVSWRAVHSGDSDSGGVFFVAWRLRRAM
jgi:hypothetical protein